MARFVGLDVSQKLTSVWSTMPVAGCGGGNVIQSRNQLIGVCGGMRGMMQASGLKLAR